MNYLQLKKLTIATVEGSFAPINVAPGYFELNGDLVIEGNVFSANVAKDIVSKAKYNLNGHNLILKGKANLAFESIDEIVDNSAGDVRGNVTFEKTDADLSDITIKRIDNIGELSIPANMAVVNTDSISAKRLNISGQYIAAMCDKGEKGFVDTVECVDNCGVFYFKDYDGKMSAKYDFTVNKFAGDVRVDRYSESEGYGYPHYYPCDGGFPRGFKLFNYTPETDEDGYEIRPIGYAGIHYKEDDTGTPIARGRYSCFEYKNGAVYARSTARVIAKADWIDNGEWDLFYYYDEEGFDEMEQEECVYLGVNTDPAKDANRRTFKLYPVGGNGVATYTLSDTNAATLKVEKIKNEETGIVESVATVVVNKNVNWDFDINVQIDGITRTINVIGGTQELFEGLNDLWVVGDDNRIDYSDEQRFMPYYSAGTLSYEFYLEKVNKDGKNYYRPYDIRFVGEDVPGEGFMSVPHKRYLATDSPFGGEEYSINLVNASGNIIFLDNSPEFLVPTYSCYFADSENASNSECSFSGRLIDCEPITGLEINDGEEHVGFTGVRLKSKSNQELTINAENGYCDKERIYIQYQFGKMENELVVDSIGPEIVTDDGGKQCYIIKGLLCDDENFQEKMKDYRLSGHNDSKLEWVWVPVESFDSSFKWNAPVDISYKFSWEGQDDQIQAYQKEVYYNTDDDSIVSVAAYAIVNKAPKNALKLSDVAIKNDGWVKDSKGKAIGRWNWVNADSTMITAYNEASIQYFQAYFEPVADGLLAEEGRIYATLPVAVTQVNGFNMIGSKNIPVVLYDDSQKDMRYALQPNIIGYEDIRDKDFIKAINDVFTITWSDKSGGKLVTETVAQELLDDTDRYGNTYGSNYCRCIYVPYSVVESTAYFTTAINATITSANGANKLQATMNVQYIKQYVGDINIKPVTDYASIGANNNIEPGQWIENKWEGTNLVAYYQFNLDWADIKSKQNDVYAVEAVNPWEGIVGSLFDTTKFTWTSSDKNVVSVSGIKSDKVYHKALLTVKKPGKAVITVKSTDKNAASRQIVINVVDHTPQFDSKVFTFSKYSGANAEQYVSTVYGESVSSITFEEGTPDVINNNLAFDIGEKGKFTLVLKGSNLSQQKAAMEALKKGTFDKLKLNVKVKDSNKVTNDYTIEGFKIIITDTKPTVKMSTKGKVNLFYSNIKDDWEVIGEEEQKIYNLGPDAAVNNKGIFYTLNANVPIKSVRIESPALKDSYDVKSVDGITSPTTDSYTDKPGYTFFYNGDVLTILPVGLSKDTVQLFSDKNSPVAKVKVVIYFDEPDSIYAEARAYKTDIVVPVENKKSKLTFVSNEAVIGQHAVEAYVWDANLKNPVFFMDEELEINIPAKNNGIVVEQMYIASLENGKEYFGSFAIRDTNESNKTVSYKATLDSCRFTATVEVTGKYVYAKQPALVMANSNAYINLSTNTAYNGYSEIRMDLKNGNMNDISRISYGVDAKNKFLIDDNILDVKMFYTYSEEYDNNVPVLAVGLKKGADISKIKDGTKVKLNVKALVEQPVSVHSPDLKYADPDEWCEWAWEHKTVMSSVATVTLIFTNKNEEVSFKAKNQLNVVNRGEELRLVPTLKNTSAKIERVELTGENAKSMFYGYFDNFSNELCIFLNYSANVSLKKTYDLGAIIYLSNGRKIVWDGVSKNQKISIKPVQKLPKMKAVVTGSMSLSDPSSQVVVNMELESADYAGARVSDYRVDYGKVLRESECIEEHYDWQAFTLKLVDSRSVYSSLNKNSIKPGVYTMKISYRLSGQADNTPSQTTTVKVVIKK